MDTPACHCICTAVSGFGFPGKKAKPGVAFFLSMLLAMPAAATTPAPALVDLSLEELAMLPVTSVSKTAKPLASAPASVFVITERDIRRSGATTLPEALRLAPNLQVARADARTYAISARGFNSPFSNKLLAMIDGRTIYTPLFSGIFWDAQDVMLEDLERIEVVSGPGGTMWGANAVNGVINVVTRSAADTQGELVSIGGSSIEQHAAVRYGGGFGGGGHYRVYAKHGQHEDTEMADGTRIPSGWERSQIGFRADWNNNGDAFRLQGDAYSGRLRNASAAEIEVIGANILGRGTWTFSPHSKLSLQTYFDHTRRDEPEEFAQHLNTLDLELQHEWLIHEKHTLVWGGGYRYLMDDVDSRASFAFLPGELNMHWRNIFVQDEVILSDKIRLTLGSKWEDNPFTRWESMPSAQLAWEPDNSKLAWAGFSRAVRAPSRVDRDFYLPGNPLVIGGVPLYIVGGGPDFVSEVADVFELGYRSQPIAKISWSVTGFYSEYDKLRTIEPNENHFGYAIKNQAEADIYGVELWGSWQATARLRLHGGLVLQEIEKRKKPGSADIAETTGLVTDDPHFYWLVRSSYDVSEHIRIDSTLRHVDDLKRIDVPAYTALDLHIAWTLAPGLEFSLVGQNLLEDAHPEFGMAVRRSEHERAIYGKLVWGL